MQRDHMLQMPRAIWILHILQLIIAVLVTALSAFMVYVVPYDATIFSIFTGSYSILILIYYFVAVHASPKLYNWIALLVLEVLALVFWLACFAALGALYAILVYIGEYYVYESYRKRDLYMLSVAYTAVLIACMAISIVNFIFYCVTLGFTCTAIHRHRKAGLPFKAGETGGSQGRAVSAWEVSEANEMAFATKTPAVTAEPQTNGTPCQHNASLPLPVQTPSSAAAAAPAYPSSPAPGTVEVAGSH
ncbi:hypothetical protein KC340_g10615 [Hortaea werneckii]|nr:hypothetical protein KC342_g2498 [Hortaea werneckii]KAI7104449.1 hypothetical protein KC339_g4518 [Hortaea werneckii]KAI7244563.1 hypothetical protein KC365_g1284 [Hortaea werneckii]KAI7309979.1 hypothetical protein KC340_g10615 [Hortaea werneckii]KAI7388729.1 hypothetical protein KC328_g8807 [Hortaea werneckii]